MLKHGVPQSDSALYESELSRIAATEGFHIHFPGEGCCSVTVLHAAMPVIPASHESISLVFRGIGHKEHQRRCSVIVEETLLELSGKLVNLNLIGDALSYAKPSHGRV